MKKESLAFNKFFLLLLLILLSGIISPVISQDIIEMNSYRKIKVKIVEKSPTEIRYLLWSKQNTDTISLDRSDILLITHDSLNKEIMYGDSLYVGKEIHNDSYRSWVIDSVGFLRGR